MISFIIINYQSKQLLKRCLESIQRNIESDFEIIVFNNDRKESIDFPEGVGLKIVNSPKNVGFAAGCNAASFLAKGDYLFFLNPDTEISSINTTSLLNDFKNPTTGIVAPLVLSGDGTEEKWSYGREPTLLRILLENFFPWKENGNNRIDWVSGAAFLIKKELFKKIGRFDENFFMYFEDVDLCKRVRSFGFRVVKNKSATIKHLGGKSFSSRKSQKNLYYKSQQYYFKKHFGPIMARILGFLRFFHFQ